MVLPALEIESTANSRSDYREHRHICAQLPYKVTNVGKIFDEVLEVMLFKSLKITE